MQACACISTVAGLSVAATGERISAVGAVDAVRANSGPGAETIDAAGRFLIPGLWDMHVHLGGLDGGTRRRRSAGRTARGRAPPTAQLAAARSRCSRLEQTRRVRVQLDRTLATELDRGEPEKALAFRRMRMAMSDAREGQRLNLPREGIGRQQPVERRHPPPRLDLQTFDLRRRVRAQHAALDGTSPRVADHAGIVARRGDTPPASDPPFPPRRPSGMAETEPSPGEVRRRPRRIFGHHARKEARRRATSGHALPASDRRPGQSAPQPRQHRELVEPSAWPAELTRRWTVPVGQGYATPIIVGDRVFIFTRQIVAGRARRPRPRPCRGAMSGHE